jgi:hypothetical protein
MGFAKPNEYIFSICCVHKMLYDKSREKKDVKLYYITVMILKYITKMCDELGIETKTLTVSDKFDLAPIYEYIRVNDIHLYNLETIADGDLDPNNPDDVERFILSHIQYIFTRMRAS